MKTVIVTGASGFIGKPSVRHLLEAGFIVHAIGFNSHCEETEHPRLHQHTIDLLDQAQVDQLMRSVKATHLLHLAWYVEPGKFWTAPENLDWVAASVELVRKFAMAGGERVVCAGTCQEYDLSSEHWLSEYETPLRPRNLYGESKKTLYIELENLTKELGVSFAWGRPFFLFGPGEDERRLVPYVVSSLLRGEIAECSHGNQIRDFSDVEFVAEGFVRLLRSDVEGAVNIASGNGITIRKLVEMTAEIIGSKGRILFGAIAVGPDEPVSVVGDTRRLTNEVGFTRKPDLRAELERTVEWWRHRNLVRS